jgi:hypothetical protein
VLWPGVKNKIFYFLTPTPTNATFPCIPQLERIMPKGSVPRNKNVLRANTLPDGAQQYVRGKSPYERLKTAQKAARSTQDPKAEQMLKRAAKAEMTPAGRARLAQMREEFKKQDLRYGRQRAEIMKKKK